MATITTCELDGTTYDLLDVAQAEDFLYVMPHGMALDWNMVEEWLIATETCQYHPKFQTVATRRQWAHS